MSMVSPQSEQPPIPSRPTTNEPQGLINTLPASRLATDLSHAFAIPDEGTRNNSVSQALNTNLPRSGGNGEDLTRLTEGQVSHVTGLLGEREKK